MRPSVGKGGESPKLVIRLAPELLAALRRAAAEDRRTLSDYVRLVLIDHMKAKGKKKGGR